MPRHLSLPLSEGELKGVPAQRDAGGSQPRNNKNVGAFRETPLLVSPSFRRGSGGGPSHQSFKIHPAKVQNPPLTYRNARATIKT